MKSLVKLLFAVGVTTVATGCEKFLDINTNPNNPTSVTPDAQLANALTVTAANYTGGLAGGNNYNTYASFAAGFWTKSGTVSGFSTERTYLYNNTYNQTLFNSTYDNLEDYQQIQDGAAAYPNHAAIARIMKVYNYLLLVDQFGDIPYTEALKGIANTTPTYDKADAIYKDLVEQLKKAVSDINAVPATALAVANEDVVFNGGATGMLRWKQFANSLRLRILLRESSTSNSALNTYVVQEMAKLQADATAGDGFIARDVVVQPTYTANANQQNPFYDRYGFAPGASRAQGEYSFILPTNFLINQYLQNKDPRITQYYRVGAGSRCTCSGRVTTLRRLLGQRRRTRSGWPVETAHSESSRRSRSSATSRSSASRSGREITSLATSGSTATTRSRPSTPSSAGSSGGSTSRAPATAPFSTTPPSASTRASSTAVSTIDAAARRLPGYGRSPSPRATATRCGSCSTASRWTSACS